MPVSTRTLVCDHMIRLPSHPVSHSAGLYWLSKFKDLWRGGGGGSAFGERICLWRGICLEGDLPGGGSAFGGRGICLWRGGGGGVCLEGDRPGGVYLVTPQSSHILPGGWSTYRGSAWVGSAWRGVYLVPLPPPRYAEIWSTGSWYASYWNAFLF